MSGEARVTYEETTAALAMFREWEDLASDIDGMWAVLKADREAQAARVVAEEPEWEYGFNWVDHPYVEPHMVALGADEDIAAWATRVEAEIGEVRLYQRTAPTTAGEWVPVKQEGAER